MEETGNQRDELICSKILADSSGWFEFKNLLKLFRVSAGGFVLVIRESRIDLDLTFYSTTSYGEREDNGRFRHFLKYRVMV